MEHLRRVFTEAISCPEIAVLSIATRPDCLGEEVLELLEELNRRKPVWVELGLQTIHEKTATFIRRGYPLPVFDRAVKELEARGIEIIVHTILGLPGEDSGYDAGHHALREQYAGCRHKASAPAYIKAYRSGRLLQHTGFHILTMNEYVDLVIRCLEVCRPDLVIHRLTGDGPKDLLIAPEWSQAKRQVLNTIQKELKRRNTFQGRLYSP